MTKIKYTKITLKDWNRKHFGIVQTRIGEIKRWIDSLQNLPQTAWILEEEDMARKERMNSYFVSKLCGKKRSKNNG